MTPQVSIVLPSFNGGARIGSALAALVGAADRSPQPVEVIAVDNGSSDDTSQVIAGFPTVRLLRLEQNQGFGGGVEAGCALATGRILGILSDDVVVDPDFFSPLLAHFERDETFAVMPRILTPAGDRMDIAPTLPALRRGELRLRSIEPLPEGALESPAPLTTFFAAGGMSLYRRDRFDALGGFDAIYLPGYHEDVDVTWRAWARGWASYFEPRSVAVHDHDSGAFSTEYRHVRRRTFIRRNWILMNLIHRDRAVTLQLLGAALHAASRVARRLLHPSKFMGSLLALPLVALRLPAALRKRRAERRARVNDNEAVFRIVRGAWDALGAGALGAGALAGDPALITHPRPE